MGKLALVQPGFITAAKKGIALTGNVIVKQSPIILAGTAIIGVGATGYLAYKAGLKVSEVLRNAEEEKGEPLTKEEKIQTGWKLCVPPVVSGTLTVGAIVASTAISEKRRAALAGLYAISETALKDYQKKIEETYGPKKEQDIRDRVAADKVRHDTVPWDDGSYNELVPVKDGLTGRIKPSSRDIIVRAINEMNSAILDGDMCWSLNDFYISIGWDPCDLGSETGWNLSNLARPYFTSALTSEMRPILVLGWDVNGAPTPNYRDI